LKAKTSFREWLLTEAIIDWQGHGAEDLLQAITDPGIVSLRVDELKRMAEPYGVEVVGYDQFLRELPRERLGGVPPARAPFFALINPNTERPRLVINVPILFARERMEVAKMLKHELIHLGQLHRRPIGLGVAGQDVGDPKAYFSNKDEVMAFAQSVVEDLLAMGASTVEEGIRLLSRSKLWQWIKQNATESSIKRYRKYVYLYLKLELEGGLT